MNYSKSILIAYFLFICGGMFAQISFGKITYERKSNLFKRFKDEQTQRWIGEKNKTKIDQFELVFNDTMSVFKPMEMEFRDELSWATNKNSVQQNFHTGERISIYSVWGEGVYVKDSIKHRTWKITDSKRKICGYDCRKAIWEPNDSTRIYAWFSEEIMPPVGPETFTDLPGAILGLATEDGGVIYFAKKVEVVKLDLSKEQIKLGKNKAVSELETKEKLAKQFGSRPESKWFLEDLFLW